jgi:4-amino-4-deoxy-L-arabinose transferase-like glycosyltransferase
MVSRTFDHVHDTNAGTDTGLRYYVWQLGYALFPWTPLVPLGLARGLSAPESPRPAASALLVLWALAAFGLFSVMGTKFHHYIFPALPPLAMLAGIAVDSLADRRIGREGRDGNGLVAGALAIGGALIGAFIAWDLGRRAEGAGAPGAIRLLQLFSYRYDRPWPATLDLHAFVAVAGVLAVVLTVLFAVPPLRRIAALGLGAVALAFTVWTLAVYVPRLSPHWGQRDVIAAYYRARAGDDGPLVAYQLNWKGENFYSGNRVAIFVSSGAPFASWLGDERKRGTHVVYVVTEQGRIASLEAELHARSVRPLTDRATSNQYVLVRAEL